MLFFFTILNLLNYLDRYLLAALLPVISAELSLNNRQGGLLVSGFVVGYVLCSPLFGYLGDRWKRPPIMALGVLVWSIATAFSGLTSTFIGLFLARVCVGIGEGSFATLAPTYLKDHAKDPIDLNRRLSVFFVAIPVGSALGYALAGGVTSLLSWHYVFFIGAIPGLLLAPLLLRYKDENRTNQENYQLKPALVEIFKVPALRSAIGGYILQAFALNGIAAFITKLGVQRGFTLESISMIFGLILVVTGLLGTFVGGKLSSRFADQSKDPITSFFRFLGLTSLAGTPFLFLAFYYEDPYIFLGCAAIAELLIFAGTAPVNSIIVLSAPRHLVGLTQGVTITSLNLFGALVGPILIGWIADLSSLAVGLQLATIALFFAAVVWIRGQKVSPPMDNRSSPT